MKKSSGLFGRLVGAIETKSTSDRLILRVLFFAVITGLIITALNLNKQYLASTPVAGGTMVEGIVGIPRFVNPVLAVTRADQDVVSLIFNGLMKIDTSGQLVPDIAESVTTSDDGKTYNVVIRRNIRFHDDTPLTARDVAFTIGLMQNADLKSPQRGNWSGVTVEEINEYEMNIILDEPYTPFIENFTVGILPKHIWDDLPIEQIPFSKHNTNPIGSGPFKVDKTNENENGLIDSYELIKSNSNVKLDGLVLRFFQNEQDLEVAFKDGQITSSANLSLETIQELSSNEQFNVVREPLPRLFAVFYNQNKSSSLRDPAVRTALEMVINRSELVEIVLQKNGIPTNTPWTEDRFKVASNSSTTATTTLETARIVLEKAGWQKNSNGQWEKRVDGTIVPLSITIRTANASLFEQTSAYLKDQWQSLGIAVEIEPYEQSDLLQAVIRPRDFEALLFGIDLNRAVDLYPFWHSSQREDPGLNISQYANIEVDKLLTTARTERSGTTSVDLFRKISDIIVAERPALFLFVPTLGYVTRSDLKITPIPAISKPHERFMNISDWHMEEEERWPIFR